MHKDKLPGHLLESQVIKVWQHQLLDRTELATEEKEVIQVIYPGRINDSRGADFRDAVIATSRGLIKGDIEVHVKSGDWLAHRHHRDPVYNRVILHVVMWPNTGATTRLQNGDKVPIVALHRYISPPSKKASEDSSCTKLSVPCLKTGEHLTNSIVGKILDSAGEERFLAKVARFRDDLTQMGAGQTLYPGVMEALGYAKNKVPSLELARRLPLQVLESIVQSEISDEECLARQQALLLGIAGLLVSQRPKWRRADKLDEEWLDKLERLWAVSPQTKAMSLDDWNLFKVRPNNFPIRRLVAMSYLILRYRETGILEGVINMIKEVPVNNSHA
ncbi:DUF2851 family protein [Chloroflexota bacterium]